MYDESEHLRWLRMRLEATCAHCQDAGDAESMVWLADGVRAIDAALVRIDKLKRHLAIARAEGREALMALVVHEARALQDDTEPTAASPSLAAQMGGPDC